MGAQSPCEVVEHNLHAQCDWVRAQSERGYFSTCSVIRCEHNQRKVHSLSHRAVVVLKPFQNRLKIRQTKIVAVAPNFSKSRAGDNGKIATAEINKMAGSKRRLTRAAAATK
ncbi:hypothetical protein Fot_01833 [Forsythia ovata]|uniref:Ribosomal protein L28 n=1 Tax=Forsythia ovata TaxID=205694 RepID=A0ABD1X557_9LAMI